MPTTLTQCTPEITPERAASPRVLSSSREPAFDRRKMLANIGGDSELFLELIRLFVDRHRALVHEIELAVHRGDSGMLQQAAHTLKGTAANLCAGTVVGLASELEAVGCQGHLDEAHALLMDLQDAVRHLVDALEQES